MPEKVRRILHFHFGKEGGAERFFVNFANEATRQGWAQKFIIRPGRLWHHEIAALGEVYCSHNRFDWGALPLRMHLRKLYRSWQPDVVMAWAPRAARLLPAGAAARKIVRLGDFPTHLRYFKNADVIVGNHPGIVERVRGLGWNRESAVISNFVKQIDPKPVNRALYSTPQDAFLLVGGGRFVPRKGLDLLIRAVAAIPDLWLWLVGDGPEQAELQLLAHQFGVTDRIRFLGWQVEAIHYFAAADVFCMPSRHEPLGNILLEAWQARVPVISTLSEGPRWFANDSRDALLIEIDDLPALVASIQRLRHSPDLAQTLIAGGAERLKTFFSPSVVINSYASIFGFERAS
ncbi:MAG: glycosyltransferase [Betaproteobacteria bacterium]|nr:glycosyltransferase [Betaproteobacteria bacterium]